MIRSFHPNGVFLPSDPRAGFSTSAYVSYRFNQSKNCTSSTQAGNHAFKRANPVKYHVVALYLQPMICNIIVYCIITTMFNGVLHCFCFVFTVFLESLHGD